MLHTTISDITSLTDLRPSPRVNALFTQLVNEIVAASPDLHTPSKLRTKIQNIASAAESELECYWARQIIASHRPRQTLASFPYAANYMELVKRELELFTQSGGVLGKTPRILMVGTGPLPMTALQLIHLGNARVDHVDISPQALQLCASVSNRLGLTCGHILGDGAKIILSKEYEAVFIAALAGRTVAQKQAIIDNVLPSLAPRGRIVLRSASGPRTLLYPGVSAKAFSGVTLLEEYHPTDEVINSVFVYKKGDA